MNGNGGWWLLNGKVRGKEMEITEWEVGGGGGARKLLNGKLERKEMEIAEWEVGERPNIWHADNSTMQSATWVVTGLEHRLGYMTYLNTYL